MYVHAINVRLNGKFPLKAIDSVGVGLAEAESSQDDWLSGVCLVPVVAERATHLPANLRARRSLDFVLGANPLMKYLTVMPGVKFIQTSMCPGNLIELLLLGDESVRSPMHFISCTVFNTTFVLEEVVCRQQQSFAESNMSVQWGLAFARFVLIAS